ncbi:MAG: hypothetical protein HPY53_02865 [Brevinematales bacterium]|nr:hypothetical protein [Brevinematales bacterium]
MERFKFMVFMGALLAMFNVGYAKWDVYLKPGLGFFGDAVGYNIRLGARADVDQIFYNGVRTVENVIVGAGVFINGAGTAKASMFNMGLGLDAGYRFEIPFQGFPRLSIVPVVSFGMAYGVLSDTLYGSSQKMGVFVTPGVEVTLLLANPLQLGLDFGYTIYFYNTTVTTMSLGLMVSYTFNM